MVPFQKKTDKLEGEAEAEIRCDLENGLASFRICSVTKILGDIQIIVEISSIPKISNFPKTSEFQSSCIFVFGDFECNEVLSSTWV